MNPRVALVALLGVLGLQAVSFLLAHPASAQTDTTCNWEMFGIQESSATGGGACTREDYRTRYLYRWNPASNTWVRWDGSVSVANFPGTQAVSGTVNVAALPTVNVAEPVTVEPGAGTVWDGGTTTLDASNLEGALPVSAVNPALDDRTVGALLLVVGLSGGLLSGSVLFRAWVR